MFTADTKAERVFFVNPVHQSDTSSKMSRRRNERGREPWFASEARLPNSGLDPTKDCNHVSNEELQLMFGNKEKNKGYVYTAAKNQRLRERVVELYPAIWQCQSPPEGNFIPASFARALISEVCHLHPMNWAAYAADRWRGKKFEETHEPAITYVCKYPVMQFLDVVVNRLDRDNEEARVEYEQLSGAHLEEFRKLESLSTLPSALTQTVKDKYQFEVQCLYELLDKSKQLLERIQGMKLLYLRSGDEALIAKFKADIKRESDEILGYSSRIRMLEDHLKASEIALTLAMDEELRLKRMKTQRLTDCRFSRTLRSLNRRFWIDPSSLSFELLDQRLRFQMLSLTSISMCNPYPFRLVRCARPVSQTWILSLHHVSVNIILGVPLCKIGSRILAQTTTVRRNSRLFGKEASA